MVAEAVGTAFLVTAVIGSGIMGERLAGGNVAIALLANTVATGATLLALILVFGTVSGAHFNPAVSLNALWRRDLSCGETIAYISAQLIGACAGAVIANIMFGATAVSFSRHARNGVGQFLSEVIAAFGLVLIIAICVRARVQMVAFAVSAYITAAYWFTASTSFANPAVTIARSLTDTFAGIRPRDVPLFILAQLAGGGAATLLATWLFKEQPDD
jgi:glycerol uptake facilitator-like aquaporin